MTAVSLDVAMGPPCESALAVIGIAWRFGRPQAISDCGFQIPDRIRDDVSRKFFFLSPIRHPTPSRLDKLGALSESKSLWPKGFPQSAIALAALVAFGVLTFGCSHDAPPAAPEGRLIEITCNNGLEFSVPTIEANGGEVLTVKLTNVGDAPKNSMGHNWVLLGRGANPVQFVESGAPHQATDFIAPEEAFHVLAKTKILGPGESESVTFSAPKETDFYYYVCTFPGHYDAGMRGLLVVRNNN